MVQENRTSEAFETKLQTVRVQFLEAIAEVTNLADLETIRVAALGRKGTITGLMKQLKELEEKPKRLAGQALNKLKQEFESTHKARLIVLDRAALEEQLQAEAQDMSLPVLLPPQGSIHPISHVIDELTIIFADMGFMVAEGPDIEDDFHNFDALNMPPEHPARQAHDTFYLPPRPGHDEPHMVLRTHTSPVQIRTLRTQKPPIRIICPGRTYRSDHDATHSPNFHQVEGLVIDKAIHMGHLKGCLIEFCRIFFEMDDLPVRFRPSYFPFTEPSAEVDIGCSRAHGQLSIGKGRDWLEILGCGMVHPKVLENCDIDPNHYQGFAFGMGIERIAMLKYGMPDLRPFYESDLRWLRHYSFLPFDIPNLSAGFSSN